MACNRTDIGISIPVVSLGAGASTAERKRRKTASQRKERRGRHMDSRTEILLSVIGDLQRLDRLLRHIAETNEERAIETQVHVADSMAQLGCGEDVDHPIRSNGSFLASFFRSRPH